MFYGGAFIAYLGVRHYFKAKLRRMPRNHSVREKVPKTRTGAMLREGAPADVTFLAVNGDDGAHFPICDECKVFEHTLYVYELVELTIMLRQHRGIQRSNLNAQHVPG